MKDIAVITINYNSSKFTLECIAAVLRQTNPAITYEIIVVDNNSKIDDYRYLHKNLPDNKNIFLYRNFKNTGFGGGNMFGAQHANAKYLLFLNNDTVLQNDCLQILKSFMDTHLDVGVGTAQNYNEKGEFVPCIDHYKGIRKLIFGRGLLEQFYPKKHPKRKKKYSTPTKANTVNGAFLFFRTEVFAIVGGFDTNIFLYFEEMDICYRIAKKGFSSMLVPKAKVLHYLGQSIGKSQAIRRESMRSYLYVVRKNYSLLKYKGIQSYYLLTFLFKPKKWYLYSIVFFGADISRSLKQKEEIVYNEVI